MRVKLGFAKNFAILATLLVTSCSKNSSPQPQADVATNATSSIEDELSQSPNNGKTESPAGVTTGLGLKPYAWPKPLVPLPLGQKVRYRNTDYSVMAFLEDKDVNVSIMRGDGVVCKLPIGGRTGFGIFDVATPMPVLEGWAERFDGLICRWLMVPIRENGRTIYELSYAEVYTTDPGKALSPEPHRAQLWPDGKTSTVYFLGRMTTTTQENADKRLKEALNIL